MGERQKPTEAEQSVLGAVLLDNGALLDVSESLRPQDFSDARHRVIYSGMLELHARKTPIDEVSLTAHLKATGRADAAGGALYCSDLVERTPTAANVNSYAQIVREASGVRELYQAARDAMKRLEEGDDASQVRERLIAAADAITSREPARSFDLRDELQEVVYEMERRHETGAAVSPESYVPTGIHGIDRAIIGFGMGQLVVLAGRPRMGKTALALDLAHNVALAGHRVHIFSAEMGRRDLARRTMASKAKIEFRKLRAGMFDQDDWGRALHAINRLEPGRLTIDDQSPITTREIRARAGKEHRRERLSLVVVDYAQKLQPSSRAGNREQDVAQIARDLKDLSRLGFCVLALAQENKAASDDYETRGNDRMLRESDTLFAEADVVLRIKRRHVFDKTADPRDALLEVCKQRDGEEVDVQLCFIGAQQRFEDPSAEFLRAATPSPALGHWTDEI